MSSITILKAHKRKGGGAYFVCPISNLSGHLAVIIYVDNTDHVHFDMHEDQEVEEAHAALSDSIHNWENLLVATGGSFQLIKCFYHMILFVFTKCQAYSNYGHASRSWMWLV